MKNRAVRIEIRVKRSQGLTPDSASRGLGARLQEVYEDMLSALPIAGTGRERLRGCRRRAGGPAQPRCWEQLEAGGHR